MANKPEVLIIDNDKQLVDSLAGLFRAKGFNPFGIYAGQKGLELALNDTFSVILVDSGLTDINSLELVKRIRGLKVAAPVIVLTTPENLNRAIEMYGSGAINVLIKPLNDSLVFQAAINAINQLNLENNIARLQNSLSDQYKIIGNSPIIEQFREKLKRIAGSSSRALITGEPGAGKRTAARFIHFGSKRATGPFLWVNCTSVRPGNADDKHRLECDIFGYEKGAFVGAKISTPGKLELAAGGTLYFDEVGSLTPDLQARLFRAVESGGAIRLGGVQEIKTDTRILAGSSINLESEVRAGRFREDLYFRLNVIPVAVPPLRDYKSDIPYLVRHLFDQAGFIRKRLDSEAVDYVKSLDWPGNLRQLKDVITLAAAGTPSDIIGVDNIRAVIEGTIAPVTAGREIERPAEVPRPAGLYKSELDYRNHVIDFERRLLNEVLAEAKGNITRAAAMLQTDRGNLSKKIKKLGLKE